VQLFDVQGIEIQAPKAKVFEFVSNPHNLPRWTQAFRQADERRALFATPAGQVEIGLKTEASALSGTVDWRLEFPDGGVAVAQSRVSESPRGTTVYTFLLHAPPLALEQLEGALAAQVQIVRGELATLRELLES
jgi:uncharacterized protein YndB with AHSA1/START domain